MLEQLLKGVYDQGIRDWLILKYNEFLIGKDGEIESPQFAYNCTELAAHIIFGKETWRIKNQKY